EQVHIEDEIVIVSELVGAAEKLFTRGPRRTLKGRCGSRDLAFFKNRQAGGLDVEERVLAEDRVIALEDVLIARVPPVPFHIGIIIEQWVPLVVAVPGREADAPAILDGNEM